MDNLKHTLEIICGNMQRIGVMCSELNACIRVLSSESGSMRKSIIGMRAEELVADIICTAGNTNRLCHIQAAIEAGKPPAEDAVKAVVLSFKGRIQKHTFIGRVFRSALAVCLTLACGTASAEINITRLIQVESSGHAGVVSEDGCVGLMQLSRYAVADYNAANGTAYRLSQMRDPALNVQVGRWYLGRVRQYAVSRGSAHPDRDALICYNWGMGNWLRWKHAGSRWNSLPNETQSYIKKILGDI